MNNIQRDRENRGDIFVNKKIDKLMSRPNHIRKAKIFSFKIQSISYKVGDDEDYYF